MAGEPASVDGGESPGHGERGRCPGCGAAGDEGIALLVDPAPLELFLPIVLGHIDRPAGRSLLRAVELLAIGDSVEQVLVRGHGRPRLEQRWQGLHAVVRGRSGCWRIFRRSRRGWAGREGRRRCGRRGWAGRGLDVTVAVAPVVGVAVAVCGVAVGGGGGVADGTGVPACWPFASSVAEGVAVGAMVSWGFRSFSASSGACSGTGAAEPMRTPPGARSRPPQLPAKVELSESATVTSRTAPNVSTSNALRAWTIGVALRTAISSRGP